MLGKGWGVGRRSPRCATQNVNPGRQTGEELQAQEQLWGRVLTHSAQDAASGRGGVADLRVQAAPPLLTQPIVTWCPGGSDVTPPCLSFLAYTGEDICPSAGSSASSPFAVGKHDNSGKGREGKAEMECSSVCCDVWAESTTGRAPGVLGRQDVGRESATKDTHQVSPGDRHWEVKRPPAGGVGFPEGNTGEEGKALQPGGAVGP